MAPVLDPLTERFFVVRQKVNAAQRRSGLSWEKVFAEADADGSGTLTQAELKQVIREKLGLRSTINDHDVKALFEHVDCDCSGSIELEELLDYMRTGSVQDDSDEANLVKNAKRVERVQQAISLAFSKISSNEADIRKLFHDIDPDGDGTLSEFEFMGFVREDLKLSIWNCKKKDLMAFYHYLDKDGDGLDVDDLVDYVCRGEAGAYLKDRQEKPRGFGAALGPIADAEKELGNAEFRKGNYDQAIVHFTNAGAPVGAAGGFGAQQSFVAPSSGPERESMVLNPAPGMFVDERVKAMAMVHSPAPNEMAGATEASGWDMVDAMRAWGGTALRNMGAQQSTVRTMGMM